ncbi:hypothetical protein C6499_21780 [Candidatus Poribacteria bacterium]|nr:MAG: hypothetical protein C6499_21780 [Candidatus Poribacteria bacterium]
MKMIFSLILTFLTLVFLPKVFAQSDADSQLPTGVKAYIECSGKITGNIQYSPEGKELAVASDMGIWLYDARNGAEVALLSGHNGDVLHIAYSPDGKMLASAGRDETVRLWNPKTGENLAILAGHDGLVNGVAFSPDGKTLVSGSGDATVRLWSVEKEQQIWFAKTPQAQQQGITDPIIREAFDLPPLPNKSPFEKLMFQWVLTVAYSPDGKTLASSGSSDGTIQLWDVETGKQLRTLKGHTEMVNTLAFSPDSTTLVSGSKDDSLRVWNPNTGSVLRKLSGHSNDIRSVVFSHDGKMLASGSKDSSVRLWDAKTWRFLPTLRGHYFGVRGASFSPDGKTVVSAADSRILFWDWKKLEKTQK